MFDITENNVVIVKPEMLTIIPFKKIHEKYSKEEAYKYFSYIYFKNDFKSPYKRSYEEDELEGIILEEVIGDSKWKPNALILEAEKVYNELQDVKSLKALDAAERALAQVSKYFNEFDIDNLTEDRKHLAITNVMRNLKEIDEVIDKISKARERVEKELLNKSIAGKRKLGKREIPKSQR